MFANAIGVPILRQFYVIKPHFMLKLLNHPETWDFREQELGLQHYRELWEKLRCVDQTTHG